MQCPFAGKGFSPENQKKHKTKTERKNDYVIYWRGLRQKKKKKRESQITIRMNILCLFDVAIRIFMLYIYADIYQIVVNNLFTTILRTVFGLLQSKFN